MYVQVDQLLTQWFPGVKIVATNYPPDPWKAAVAKALSYAQFSAIGALIAGEHTFNMLGTPIPQWWRENVAANRMPVGCGVWFVGNLLTQQLTQTGAFEVYANGQLVFSLLREKRMFTAPELIEGISKAGIAPSAPDKVGRGGSNTVKTVASAASS